MTRKRFTVLTVKPGEYLMKQIDSVGSIPVRVKKNLLRVLKDRVCCPVSVQK